MTGRRPAARQQDWHPDPRRRGAGLTLAWGLTGRKVRAVRSSTNSPPEPWRRELSPGWTATATSAGCAAKRRQQHHHLEPRHQARAGQRRRRPDGRALRRRPHQAVAGRRRALGSLRQAEPERLGGGAERRRSNGSGPSASYSFDSDGRRALRQACAQTGRRPLGEEQRLGAYCSTTVGPLGNEPEGIGRGRDVGLNWLNCGRERWPKLSTISTAGVPLPRKPTFSDSKLLPFVFGVALRPSRPSAPAAAARSPSRGCRRPATQQASRRARPRACVALTQFRSAS